MIDLFEKCRKPSLASELKEKGIYPYFHALESRQAPEVVMEGRRRIMLGSNNYLGLTTCPEVIEAGIKAFEQYGTGCSGSRFLNGTLEMHLELEAELAKFLRKEAVVTFSTGFQSNLGIISAIVGRGDVVIWSPSCKRCRKRRAALSSPMACSAWAAILPSCRKLYAWPSSTAPVSWWMTPTALAF